jgi:uncharacterized protein (DUF885 family)
MLFTNRGGWHQSLADSPDSLCFRGKADYENYLTRLSAYPALNDEALRVSTCVERRLCAAVRGDDGVDQTISGVIPADATKSRSTRRSRRSALQHIGGRLVGVAGPCAPLIEGDCALMPSIPLVSEPICAPLRQVGRVSSQPNGRAYYDWLIGQFTAVNMNADEIHALGLRRWRGSGRHGKM